MPKNVTGRNKAVPLPISRHFCPKLPSSTSYTTNTYFIRKLSSKLSRFLNCLFYYMLLLKRHRCSSCDLPGEHSNSFSATNTALAGGLSPGNFNLLENNAHWLYIVSTYCPDPLLCVLTEIYLLFPIINDGIPTQNGIRQYQQACSSKVRAARTSHAGPGLCGAGIKHPNMCRQGTN